MKRIEENKKYLCVCDFAQSRSLYFAEELNKKGVIALRCGFDNHADIKLNKKLIDWADIVIILSSSYKYDDKSADLVDYVLISEKELILKPIDDELPIIKETFIEVFGDE